MAGRHGNREIGRWKYALPVLMLLLSYLMVSNFDYPSFKAINIRTKRSFHWVLIMILVVALLVIGYQWMPTVVFVSYLLYGLVRPWISRKWRHEIEDFPDTTIDENGSGAAPAEEAAPPGDVKTDPATQI